MSKSVLGVQDHFFSLIHNQKHNELKSFLQAYPVNDEYLNLINSFDEYDNTAINFAAINGDVQTVEILLEFYADPDLVSENKSTPYTPLQNSILKGYKKLVNLLVSHRRVNVEYCISGKPPLFLLVDKYPALAKRIIEEKKLQCSDIMWCDRSLEQYIDLCDKHDILLQNSLKADTTPIYDKTQGQGL